MTATCFFDRIPFDLMKNADLYHYLNTFGESKSKPKNHHLPNVYIQN